MDISTQMSTRCQWPWPCKEKPVVKMQMLDYCENHARLVQENRDRIICEFNIRKEKIHRLPKKHPWFEEVTPDGKFL